MTRSPMLFWIMMLCMIQGLSACVSAVDRNKQFSQDHDLQRSIVHGEDFDHVVYFNQAALTSSGGWHVYIEGDGIPWIRHQYVADDPTAPLPLMLRLMSQDQMPSIYLGRPCYEGLAKQAGCGSWFWTQGRYSRPIVDSMAAVLRKLVQAYQVPSFTLIGHSGGGTLAMLMSPSLAEVKRLVTIAGNLDTSAWVETHGYSPLVGSLNPATQANIPGGIEQYHYFGKQDRNIPLQANLRFLKSQVGAHVMIVDHCAHTDCWEYYYEKMVLNQVSK